MTSNKWDKLPNESAKAYEAFLAFIAMPLGERTKEAVSKQLGKSSPLITRWARAYNWNERATAFDSAKGQSVTQARVKEEVKWEQRRLALINKHREDEIKAAEKLREKAHLILDTLPIAKQTIRDSEGGRLTIVNPASSAEYMAAVRMFALAGDKERDVLEMGREEDEGNISISWRNAARANGVNETTLFEHVKNAIVNSISGKPA